MITYTIPHKQPQFIVTPHRTGHTPRPRPRHHFTNLFITFCCLSAFDPTSHTYVDDTPRNTNQRYKSKNADRYQTNPGFTTRFPAIPTEPPSNKSFKPNLQPRPFIPLAYFVRTNSPVSRLFSSDPNSHVTSLPHHKAFSLLLFHRFAHSGYSVTHFALSSDCIARTFGIPHDVPSAGRRLSLLHVYINIHIALASALVQSQPVTKPST